MPPLTPAPTPSPNLNPTGSSSPRERSKKGEEGNRKGLKDYGMDNGK